MPEGDTVWLTAKRLNDALAGLVVSTFDLRVPQLATADLRGEVVREVLARGKHILMRFENDLTLHSHLRMDGSWHLGPAGRPATRRAAHTIRALVGNDRWLATGFRVHDLRLVTAAAEGELVGHLGPDLLGPDWDEAEALRRLRAQADAAIGDALLDQRNLAGVGNMYKAEVLFMTGVNPWLPVAAVPDLGRVVQTAQRVLRRNRDHPQQSTTGSTVRGMEHWAYVRAGQACRKCGTKINVASQGPPTRERETYWCPVCQPGPGPQPGA
jgi:endonuclease-8